MKRLIPVLVAAAIGAAVLLRPVPPPTAAGASGGAAGWSSEPPDAHGGAHGRRTPSPQAMVYVTGEVARPGVYAVAATARARDALKLAGGTRPNADLVAVNLAAHVRDGDEIVVPARGDPDSTPARSAARGHGRRTGGAHRGSPRSGHGKPVGRHRRSRHDVSPANAEVDVNMADADELATVPGIGEGLAKRIVMFREQNGAFASVDELLDVAGITEHRLDAMLPYVVAR